MPQLILTLVSGQELRVTHVRLVNAEIVESMRARLQELATVTGRQSGTAVAFGDPEFVVGVMAAASIVSWFAQKSQAAEVQRLTGAIATLVERARNGGAFYPVAKVEGIQIPIPTSWQAEVTKRLRTESGTADKTIRLCHSGDAFVTVQTDDNRELTVFWDKVESIEFRNEA